MASGELSRKVGKVGSVSAGSGGPDPAARPSVPIALYSSNVRSPKRVATVSRLAPPGTAGVNQLCP